MFLKISHKKFPGKKLSLSLFFKLQVQGPKHVLPYCFQICLTLLRYQLRQKKHDAVKKFHDSFVNKTMVTYSILHFFFFFFFFRSLALLESGCGRTYFALLKSNFQLLFTWFYQFGVYCRVCTLLAMGRIRSIPFPPFFQLSKLYLVPVCP